MANYRAIAAAGAPLAGLIHDRYSRAEVGTLGVRLCQPRDFETPMRDGFAVLLYRVTINGSVRNLAHRRTPEGRRFRPSLPLDLHYTITPFATDAERQHRMLGWVMRALEDLSQLS